MHYQFQPGDRAKLADSVSEDIRGILGCDTFIIEQPWLSRIRDRVTFYRVRETRAKLANTMLVFIGYENPQ